MISPEYLNAFIHRQHLPADYHRTVEQWFAPLCRRIAAYQKSNRAPLTLAINGVQGSGKTTLAALLVNILTQEHGLRACSMSLDDFYYGKQERQMLAETVHPLLATRGVPGTHDIKLAISTLDQLRFGVSHVALPSFSKAQDDSLPFEHWPVVMAPMDIIIFEGWCMGAQPQSPEQLLAPINTLEELEDPQRIWRNYANGELSGNYSNFFKCFDLWIMLQAPAFECVYPWRLEQEHKLAQKMAGQGYCKGIMSNAEVARFIQFYERISRQLLTDLPHRCDFVFTLDEKRKITGLTAKDNE